MADHRRVLILSAAFPPWGGGGVIRMTKLVKYLPELGWDVTVVCSDEARPALVDESLLSEIPDEVRVVRVRGPLNHIGGKATGAVTDTWRSGRFRRATGILIAAGRSIVLPDRWIGWAATVARMGPERLGPPNVIVSTGPPHSTHLAGVRLARKLHVPLVVDMRDDWAANPFGRNAGPWQPAADAFLEGWVLQRASRIVVVSDRMKERLARRHPGISDRIVVITNGYDPADLVGLPVRQPVRPGDPVRFLYAGRLLNRQSVGAFWQVFGEAARDGSMTLELKGWIEPDQLREARYMIGPQLTVSPPSDHKNAVRVMAEADVLVVVTEGGGAGAGTMTGKIYEYLALRRPILLIGPEGDAAELVSSSQAGVVAKPEDADALRAAIRETVVMASNEGFSGAQAEVIARFDRIGLARSWSDLLEVTSLAG